MRETSCTPFSPSPGHALCAPSIKPGGSVSQSRISAGFSPKADAGRGLETGCAMAGAFATSDPTRASKTQGIFILWISQMLVPWRRVDVGREWPGDLVNKSVHEHDAHLPVMTKDLVFSRAIGRRDVEHLRESPTREPVREREYPRRIGDAVQHGRSLGTAVGIGGMHRAVDVGRIIRLIILGFGPLLCG